MKSLTFYKFLGICCFSLQFYFSYAQSSTFQKLVDVNLYTVNGIVPFNDQTQFEYNVDQVVCFSAEIGSNGKEDIVVLNISPSGKVLRERILRNNPDFHDWVLEFLRLDDNYFLTGSSRSLDTSIIHNESAYLLRLDSDLEIMKQTNYIINGQELFTKSITNTADGNILISGATVKDNNWSYFILKTSEEGSVLWYKEYNAQHAIDVSSIRELNNGDLLVVGSIAFQFQYLMPVAMRLSASGEPIWSKVFNYNINPFANQNSAFRFIHDLGNGSILIAGQTDYSGEASNGFMDSYVVKINNSGEIIWSKTYGGDQSDWPLAYSFINDQLVISGGTGTFFKYTNYGFLQFIDTSGNLKDAFVVGDTVQKNQIALSGVRYLDKDKYMIFGYQTQVNNFNFYYADLLKSSQGDCEAYTVNFNSLDASMYPVADINLSVNNTISPFVTNEVFHYYQGLNTSVICESEPNSSPDLHNANALSVFPNPAFDLITLKLDNNNINCLNDINIFNQLGQKVLSYNNVPNNEQVIDISALPSGSYTLVLSNYINTRINKFIKM